MMCVRCRCRCRRRRLSVSRSSSAMMHQSAIIIADYDHHTKISGKSVHFHSFMCAVGTVVLSKQLSCTLLEKDIKGDVSIDHQNRKSSAMMHQSAIIADHRNQDYNSSHYLLLNMVRSTQNRDLHNHSQSAHFSAWMC